MNFCPKSEIFCKLTLVAGLGGVLLSGCGGKTDAESGAPDGRPELPPSTRDVASDDYSRGLRIVTFRAEGSTVLTQVIETCDDDTLVKRATYVRRLGNDYRGKSYLKNERNHPACSDGRITQADQLPIPLPPSPSLPSSPDSTESPAIRWPIYT